MDEKESEYIEDLESALSKFLKPLEDIKYHVLIKSVHDYKVIPIDLEDEKDGNLIDDLSQISKISTKSAYEEGIFRSRPNEVGNDMENYVKKAFKEIGLRAETPQREDGKKQATGYPDFYFVDRYQRPNYLEVKTYNKENIDTSQRSFYMSPPKSNKSKITTDARHLVVSFEIKRETRDGERCYYPVGWKIISPYNMAIKVKHEFNASNRDLYREEAILEEGSLEQK